jgi:hypothetical protein
MKLKSIKFSDEIISPSEQHTFWVKECERDYFVVMSELKNRNMYGAPSGSIMNEH